MEQMLLTMEHMARERIGKHEGNVAADFLENQFTMEHALQLVLNKQSVMNHDPNKKL